ncbi:MAG: hypothetical protein Q8P41_20875 [Pseudomonadota bacterium]|nr:hypothetical protein [Pseudomonadota bacterium]
MRIATVCSAHGFGHVTRQLVLADALAARGAEVTLYSAAPATLLAGVRHALVPWVADVGIAQRDSLTEDLPGTLLRLETVASDAAIDALAGALAGYDRVIVDIAPPALEAARRAGVPAFAVGNFDWAWIYRHYPALSTWAERFAAWQAPHPALSLAPGPGLSGFTRVEPFGVVGRRAADTGGSPVGRRAADTGDGPVRRSSGPVDRPTVDLGPDGTHPRRARTVLVCFGGFGLEGIDRWLPRIDGVTWVLAPPMARVDRPDVRWVADVPFPALVAGADALLTKPGYGIYAEAALAGTPLVWVDRGVFPEAPWLEAAMWARGDVKVEGVDVAAAVDRRLATPRPAPVASDAAERLAERILR